MFKGKYRMSKEGIIGTLNGVGSWTMDELKEYGRILMMEYWSHAQFARNAQPSSCLDKVAAMLKFEAS